MYLKGDNDSSSWSHCLYDGMANSCLFQLCVLPTNTLISSISKTLENKLYVFHESIYLQQRSVFIFLVSTVFISDCISIAAVSITLNGRISRPSILHMG